MAVYLAGFEQVPSNTPLVLLSLDAFTELYDTSFQDPPQIDEPEIECLLARALIRTSTWLSTWLDSNRCPKLNVCALVAFGLTRFMRVFKSLHT